MHEAIQVWYMQASVIVLKYLSMHNINCGQYCLATMWYSLGYHAIIYSRVFNFHTSKRASLHIPIDIRVDSTRMPI